MQITCTYMYIYYRQILENDIHENTMYIIKQIKIVDSQNSIVHCVEILLLFLIHLIGQRIKT